MSKADVRSFQAVEAFRVQLIKAAESAEIALQDAEQQGERVLNWLQGEQRSYWKSARRAAAEALTRAQDAYRQKALYRDSTGARHSAVDELVAVRRAEARAEECEIKARATQRHATELKQELQAFRGGTARLRNLLSGTVPVVAADLKQAVVDLERYAALRSDFSPAAMENQASVAREEATSAQQGALDMADDETLRRRTPATSVRERAQPLTGDLLMPDVPAGCRKALTERCVDEAPTRYDLLTARLPLEVEAEQSHVYLERVEPTSEADTGWHAGWAGEEDVKDIAVGTITFGRLAKGAPYIADLMRMPIGTLIVARANTVVRVVNAFGKVLWSGDEAEVAENAKETEDSSP